MDCCLHLQHNPHLQVFLTFFFLCVQDLTLKMCRTLKVLEEYISECDYYYLEERTMLPLYRAARGKQIALTVRFAIFAF